MRFLDTAEWSMVVEFHYDLITPLTGGAEEPVTQGKILYEKHGRVVVITINRPEVRNALDFEAFGQLANAWLSFRDDDDLWVAIITGAGDKSFCAGADLKTFAPAITENIEALAETGGAQTPEGEQFPVNASLVAVLREVEIWKPIIAAVNGVCTAGGMEMLQGTDIRVAAEHATFGIAEPRRGLFPGGGSTVKLPRQIPFARAMEILLTGERISAAEARQFGIVNRVVPAADLIPTAMQIADTICKNGPLAVRAVKEAVLRGLRLPLQEALDQELSYAVRVFATEDAQEGLRAFAEKRPAVWRGR